MKTEILFYYESRQNPNGDPGFENQPRLMPDGTIMVTDVRIKRTIRDHAKTVLGETIFVDYDKEGNPTTADKRAEEIVGSLKGDVMTELLKRTFDTSLFGALVTIRAKKGKEKGDEVEGSSQKITGPVQFGMGRSVNQVQIINPTISGRFVGKEKTGEQFSTFGKFYSVEYALIKIHGAINPDNLGKYKDDKKISAKFEENQKKLFGCLWNGTTQLITRSKFPQRSVFYLEVAYNSAIYNDLPMLVEDKPEMKGRVLSLIASPFIFDKLITTLEKRKSQVKKVRIACCNELMEDTRDLISKLKSKNIPVEEVRC